MLELIEVATEVEDEVEEKTKRVKVLRDGMELKIMEIGSGRWRGRGRSGIENGRKKACRELEGGSFFQTWGSE